MDAQFGGVDQRKIFTLASEILPKLGMKVRAHLMNPMVLGLADGKISASDPDSKIDILDRADVMKKKVRKAFAVAIEVDGNGMISFVGYVLLPVSGLKNENLKGRFVVDRREDEGGPLVYDNIDTLKDDYRADKLTPQLLKAGVTAALNNLLSPIQEDFQKNKEWQENRETGLPASRARKEEESQGQGDKTSWRSSASQRGGGGERPSGRGREEGRCRRVCGREGAECADEGSAAVLTSSSDRLDKTHFHETEIQEAIEW